MKPSIGVNGKHLRNRIVGISRYTREIISRFGENVHVHTPPRDVRQISSAIWEQFLLPLQARENHLLWSPGNMGPLTIRNQVVTIHDIVSIEHPEWFRTSATAYYRLLLPLLVRQVHKIITDSRYSKDRILKRLNVPREKVIVIPLGVGETFMPISRDVISQLLAKLGITNSYILTLGSLEPRKNLKRLFLAWKIVCDKYPDYDLVVTGLPSTSSRGTGFSEIPAHVQFVGFCADQDLPALYSGARAFILPSLYEGFGLPPLEAMACGTPVIVSDKTSLPEVTGDAGLYCDPYDIDDMAQAIQRMIEDSDLRAALREKGLQHVKSFNWNKTAQEIWKVLSTCLEELNG
jgi:glycosyltransferase involved in cell wall biosynthesis